MVSRYAERAGLEKDVRPHTLRHTAATTWLRQGFNLREVQNLLGHSSPATTEVYTHVFDEGLQRKQEGSAPLALWDSVRNKEEPTRRGLMLLSVLELPLLQCRFGFVEGEGHPWATESL